MNKEYITKLLKDTFLALFIFSFSIAWVVISVLIVEYIDPGCVDRTALETLIK